MIISFFKSIFSKNSKIDVNRNLSVASSKDQMAEGDQVKSVVSFEQKGFSNVPHFGIEKEKKKKKI